MSARPSSFYSGSDPVELELAAVYGWQDALFAASVGVINCCSLHSDANNIDRADGFSAVSVAI